MIKRFISRRQPDWLPPDLSVFLLLFVYVVWPQVDLVLALIVFLGALALLGANALLPAHPRWFEIALGVIVFALYFATLSQHVGAADTFEFQVVMPQWGIAHPTGYPLFVTLGKLFSLLPLGSMAFRLNVLSALIGTLAVWVIYRLIVRLTSDRLAGGDRGFAAGRFDRILESGHRHRSVCAECSVGGGGIVVVGEIVSRIQKPESRSG